MKIRQNEDCGSSVCVKIAKQISPVYVCHDVFNGGKRKIDVGRIMHSEKDSSYDLNRKENAH